MAVFLKVTEAFHVYRVLDKDTCYLIVAQSISDAGAAMEREVSALKIQSIENVSGFYEGILLVDTDIAELINSKQVSSKLPARAYHGEDVIGAEPE